MDEREFGIYHFTAHILIGSFITIVLERAIVSSLVTLFLSTQWTLTLVINSF